VKRIVIYILAAVLLGAVAAPSCGVSPSSGGGGAVVFVAHPWARHHGTWVLDRKGWGWVAAAATAAALGALAEGDLGHGGQTTGYSNTGKVPFADTGQCRDPNTPGEWQLERWLNYYNRLHIDCAQMRKIWRIWHTKGDAVLRCITLILARGEEIATPTATEDLLSWSWSGGKVVALRAGLRRDAAGGSLHDWKIISASPANGSWAKCAKG